MRTTCLTIACLALALTACSSEPAANEEAVAESTADTSAFPDLPTNPSETARVEGKMSNWFVEGEAGCYGSLENAGSTIQVWSDIETCGDRDYAEGAPAALVVTWRPDEQWAGNTYSIVEFK